MDCLVHYVPSNNEECEQIIERILPRLNHINPSVVLSAIKVVVRYMDYIETKEAIKILCVKCSSPLGNLINYIFYQKISPFIIKSTRNLIYSIKKYNIFTTKVTIFT